MTSDCPSAILVAGDSMTVEWMKYFPRPQNLQEPCLRVFFFFFYDAPWETTTIGP